MVAGKKPNQLAWLQRFVLRYLGLKNLSAHFKKAPQNYPASQTVEFFI